MNRFTRRTALALALASCLPGVHAQTREVNFGIISTESSNNLKTAWQPLLDDMQKVTGLKVNAFFAPDYAGVIEAMRFNKVQVAWMGNKSGAEAVDRASGEVFAKVAPVDGSQGYWSLMIVHKDSPLKTLDDVLKQRQTLTLGFGDPNSTSGSLVPGYYAFAQNKVDPTKDFKRTVRANHETNILAVANKQVDVATVASDGVDRMKIKMPEKAAELREVWRSPLIASDPLLWRKDLDADSKKKLRDFLLGYGKDAREKEVLRILTLSGFMASDNSQLVPIRQIELVRDRTKIENDANMAADEKARRIQEIEARLAELSKQVAAAK
ncbi:MAG TPA: phosphonate ABC transporter substrate-binding protein [Albitalea sp.]|uniref:phosphonate ABC transporter substrate-binding protein n=1 Tax=Piscinibacter sp. TaxID=1903157 RepID=UPI002ED13892